RKPAVTHHLSMGKTTFAFFQPGRVAQVQKYIWKSAMNCQKNGPAGEAFITWPFGSRMKMNWQNGRIGLLLNAFPIPDWLTASISNHSTSGNQMASCLNWQQTDPDLQLMKMKAIWANHWHCRHSLKTSVKKLKLI